MEEKNSTAGYRFTKRKFLPHKLDAEHTAYKQELANFLKEHDGEYVLIRRGHKIRFYTTHREAVFAGYELYKGEPFLVKEIREEDDAFTVTSLVLVA